MGLKCQGLKRLAVQPTEKETYAPVRIYSGKPSLAERAKFSCPSIYALLFIFPQGMFLLRKARFKEKKNLKVSLKKYIQ